MPTCCFCLIFISFIYILVPAVPRVVCIVPVVPVVPRVVCIVLVVPRVVCILQYQQYRGWQYQQYRRWYVYSSTSSTEGGMYTLVPAVPRVVCILYRVPVVPRVVLQYRQYRGWYVYSIEYQQYRGWYVDSSTSSTVGGKHTLIKKLQGPACPKTVKLAVQYITGALARTERIKEAMQILGSSKHF